jgi:hypothetical protein
MKKRWRQDRQGMLKKIREGVWRWLLDMEPCGCKCCKECLRCQMELKHKNREAELKTQKEGTKRTERTKSRKKRGQKSQIKSPGSRIKSFGGRRKSPRSSNKSRKSSQRANKTYPRGSKSIKDARKSSFFAKVLEILRRWKDGIWKIFKKLCKRINSNQNKTSKSSRRTDKTRSKRARTIKSHKKGLPFFARILDAIKKWKGRILGIFKRLSKRINSSQNKTSKSS